MIVRRCLSLSFYGNSEFDENLKTILGQLRFDQEMLDAHVLSNLSFLNLLHVQLPVN
jgi:hypothetical protein